jgi:fatty acid desaturase
MTRSSPRPQADHKEHHHTTPDQARGERSSRMHTWMMTICLVMMGGAILFFMWRGQTGGSLLLLLPMLLCLGMHFFLHRHGHRHHDE